jgi:hypothetical protein
MITIIFHAAEVIHTHDAPHSVCCPTLFSGQCTTFLSSEKNCLQARQRPPVAIFMAHPRHRVAWPQGMQAYSTAACLQAAQVSLEVGVSAAVGDVAPPPLLDMVLRLCCL